MRFKLNLLPLLMVFSSIRQSFSATLLTLDMKMLAEDYIRLRTASVYRGILFSLSAVQKNEICKDIFYAQLYAIFDGTENEADENNVKHLVTDGLPATDELTQYSLLFSKIMAVDETHPDWEDIFFKCVGGSFKKRRPEANVFYVSSAFLYNWYYSSIQSDEKTEYLELMHYIVSSPELVPLEQAELERHYVNIRRNINALNEESSELVTLIEKRDNLSLLSRWQKLILCASILSSPIYRKDRLEFSLEWIYETEKNHQHKENLPFLKKSLSFKNPDYNNENLIFDCIFCEAFHDVNDDDGGSKNLYLTRSYSNDHSVLVLIEDMNKKIFLDKYFKNIPVLMNARENMDESSIFVNF